MKLSHSDLFKASMVDATDTRVQGPHLHQVIPTDCEASAYPNK